MAAPRKLRIKRYGWIPDLPDQRDRVFAAAPAALDALPPRIDWRAACPPVYDQGALGSCTANAIAGALQFDELKQGEGDAFTPSRLVDWAASTSRVATRPEAERETLLTAVAELARTHPDLHEQPVFAMPYTTVALRFCRSR